MDMESRTVLDMVGRTLTFPFPPRRIVSLVPSQTELLFDLGLKDEVVGVTKYCIHPIDKLASITKIGGTKGVKLDVIHALRPDLIIANKEENLKSDIEALQRDFPVWVSNVTDLPSAMDTIAGIGQLVDRQPEAAYLNHLIRVGFADLQTLGQMKEERIKVAYLMWRKPYMAAGKGIFINDVMTKIGLQNVITQERYPIITLEELTKMAPQVIMLSTEPFPYAQKHMAEFAQALPQAKIILVNGEMFSWFGSRLIKAVGYFFGLMKDLGR